MFPFSFWLLIKYSKTIQLLFLISAVIIDKARFCFKLLYSFIDEVPPRSIQSIEKNLATLSYFWIFAVENLLNRYDRMWHENGKGIRATPRNSMMKQNNKTKQ